MSAPDPGTPAAAVPAVSGATAGEVGIALRNAVKLGLSLVCTWTVTLLIRFQLPRYLGPLEFGAFNFADSFAASFFAFLDMGVDVYIQKEVSVRPKHASDFFGGLVLLRAVVALVLVGAMTIVLSTTHRSGEVLSATLVFAAGYFVTCINTTLGAFLQSSTRVGRLAVANVGAKVAWGVGLVLCIWARQPMVYLALPMLASETLKLAFLLPATRAAIDLRFRVDPRAVASAFVSSLPYFISAAAIGITVRVNVNVLEFVAADKREVGWLGAANNLGSLAMILTPLLTWIIMPMLARARQRSLDDVFAIIRYALEGLLVLAIPVTLLIGVGADLWVRLAFGKSYAQAAMSLIAIAPQFLFTYTAMILSIALVIIDKQWQATRNSLAALFLTPLFMLVAVPLASRLGPGGAAAGAAAAVLFTEIVISGSCLYHVGRRAYDRRTVGAAGKSLAVALAVIVADHFMRPWGYVRIAVDMVLYAAGALGLGAIRVREAVAVLRAIRARRVATG